jgi:LPS-assembly protein
MLTLARLVAPRIFIAALALLWVVPSFAQFLANKNNGKILLDAKLMERDNEKDITILRDNVQVIMEQNYISCNEAVIQWSKNQIVAVGNVLLKTPKATVQADKLVYDIRTQKGQIYNGVVVSGKILIQGEYLEKIGEDTFKGDNTYLTSCTTCPASWSFTADHFEATIESYAYISNAWLNFLEFPAIYIPYLILPLKNERQSGLLPPTFEFSKINGTSIELPFFWAISRSQDLTFSVKNYTRRGVQFNNSYRYRLSEKSGGDWNSAFLNDRSLGRKRWFTNYVHSFDLPNDFVQKTSLHLASDNEYSRDFTRQFNFRGEPALDNRVSLTKNYPGYHLSFDASYYLSLLEGNVDQAKASSVHRLPEIRFSITDKKISKDLNIFYRFDAQYVNFARRGLGYDSDYTPRDANGVSTIGYEIWRPQSKTGGFNPNTDKVRTGQRLDLQPYVYAPIRLLNNTLEVTPFISVRHTQYLLGALSTEKNYNFAPHRDYLLTGLDASTELSRIYQTSDTKYRHSITPEISFQTIPYFEQTTSTFFGVQKNIPYFLQTQPLQNVDMGPEGRGLQFDYEDRVVGRRLVNYAITNKLIRKSNNTIGSRYDQTALFRLSQAYDVIEAQKTDGRPWQDIRGLLNLKMGKIYSLTEASHFPYHKVTNINSTLRMYVVKSNFVELMYSNYINVPLLPKDVNTNNRFETMWISSGVASTYTNFTVSGEYDLKLDKFKRFSIIGQLIPPGSCWLIEGNIYKILDVPNGLTYNLNVTFKFGS